MFMSWMGPSSSSKRKLVCVKIVSSAWCFHGSADVLKKKWMGSPSATIFFDGASKGNPEISGAGGVILSPNCRIETNFSWGLGTMSNNQSECYSLLMACQIANDKGYHVINIFGDSKLLIKVLNSDGHLNNSALNQILLRIWNILSLFEDVEYIHILWEHNFIADELANKACLLSQGTLCINGKSTLFHLIL